MRTKKQIDKEIQELRELDRLTTIKVNQEFSDREQQEKETKEDKTKQQKEIFTDLFLSFAAAQKQNIDFDKRLKKFVNKFNN
jgi:hypothetical protein